ncbi:hypothetical protein E3N88_05881 [Mikania micrantha]|uniref:Uncharacterized protein n=1 Tax=Mikania micrantha TaxID=192012 RepID=A0A5N6PP12_9ASTR|nr:hypothetical protein E3N88_05881 [Mikania micrantha]
MREDTENAVVAAVGLGFDLLGLFQKRTSNDFIFIIRLLFPKIDVTGVVMHNKNESSGNNVGRVDDSFGEGINNIIGDVEGKNDDVMMSRMGPKWCWSRKRFIVGVHQEPSPCLLPYCYDFFLLYILWYFINLRDNLGGNNINVFEEHIKHHYGRFWSSFCSLQARVF